MHKPLNGLWLKIPFINLLIIAFIGVILRYKIAYSLPIVDQKYLLHAHSHFAFSGWITQLLMTFIVQKLYAKNNLVSIKKYKILLVCNLVAAYGMLLSFPFQGYGSVSISFSTLSVFVSYAFAVFIWRDLNGMADKSISHPWFKAAVFFNAFSSLGAFALGYMMANKIADQELYLAAVYYFLHFQYNGWFFFAAMGLLMQWLADINITPSASISKAIFSIFFFAAFPAYFLSALWLPMPTILYTLVVIASVVQVAGLLMLIAFLKKNSAALSAHLAKPVQWLWVLSFTAFSIKIFLQAGSTIPSLNIVAYGFRPIVIGYLHLVLLGELSLFLIGYFLSNYHVQYSPALKNGLIIFVGGIVLNELALMIQGTGAMMYIAVPYISVILLVIGLVMLTGILLTNVSLRRS